MGENTYLDGDEIETQTEQLRSVHPYYGSLFYLLNEALRKTDEIFAGAISASPAAYPEFAKRLEVLVSEVAARSELGTFRGIAKHLTDIRKRVKGASWKSGDIIEISKDKKEPINSAAGVLKDPLEDFRAIIFEIGDMANKLQKPPSKDDDRLKNSQKTETPEQKTYFVGFQPAKGGAVISVGDENLQSAFKRLFSVPSLVSKFINPQVGLDKNDFKTFNFEISKEYGRSHRGDHPIFEQKVVIGEYKNQGDRSYTWYLNPSFVPVFENALH